MATRSDLLDRFRQGDTQAASRLMSMVERGGDAAEDILDSVFPSAGRAYRVAFTGGAGVGKSTLADALVRRYRQTGLNVGVIAEDPTSPFSGGAVLGDRVRMTSAVGDRGVFVRSIASRGSATGLSPLACELADILDAFGFPVILLETMGVGQVESRIRYAADTVVVVLTPESGDEVQTLKAGLLEVADVVVVNKSDRPGADSLLADLEAMVGLRDDAHDPWTPPVLATAALRGDGADGVDGLESAIAAHRAHLASGGRLEARRKEGLRGRIRSLVEERLAATVWGNPYFRERFDGIVEGVIAGKIAPSRAARTLVESVRLDARR